MIGFWATLSLNIPDFSRYAHSQRDQVVGQALGLPLTMALYSFIGVAVTSATTIIYGKTIWDPVDVLTHFTNPVVLVVAMLALCIATLATNIAANVVSPANDFAHLAPRKISFRIGGFITGIIGILMMPWKLVADPSGYIFTWLVGYSALLGPIGGIMIADYFVYRHRQLDVDGLYRADGRISLHERIQPRGADRAGSSRVLPNIPGFLVHVKLISPASVPHFFVALYDYAWFVGFGIAFVVYLLLRAQFFHDDMTHEIDSDFRLSTHQPQKYSGPSADEVLRLRKEFLNPGIFLYYKKPIMLVEGKMQYVWDETGKRYLDALGGIVTVSVGHCHPDVVAAAQQAKRNAAAFDHDLSASEHRASTRRSSPRRCRAI